MDRMEKYLAMREKALLEGALAYIHELNAALEDAKNLEDIKKKIKEDMDAIAEQLVASLWSHLGQIIDFRFSELRKEEKT